MKDVSKLFGKHPHARVLFLGSGASGKLAADKPAEWFDANYHVVIVPNLSYSALTAQAQASKHCAWYSLTVEQVLIQHPAWWQIPDCFVRIMRNQHGRYPRGWAIDKWPEFAAEMRIDWSRKYLDDTYAVDLTSQPAWRPGNDYTGLAVGKREPISQYEGTCCVQAMHFAYLLGACSIDLIGVEHCCYGGVHHYFEADKQPFQRLEGLEPCPPEYLMTVDCDGQKCLTHKHFYYSVPFTEAIAQRLTEAKCPVHRMCGGLLKKIPYKELPE